MRLGFFRDKSLKIREEGSPVRLAKKAAPEGAAQIA
jgi:hypothetical protein